MKLPIPIIEGSIISSMKVMLFQLYSHSSSVFVLDLFWSKSKIPYYLHCEYFSTRPEQLRTLFKNNHSVIITHFFLPWTYSFFKNGG